METEKLYSPLNFYIRDNEEADAGQYDDADYWRDPLSHEEAFAYKDSIDRAIFREMEGIDPKRGLAEYVPDSLDDIILSLHPSIELHGDSLWCVANITMTRPITPGEMGELSEWWTGQLSDGWGEGLEQRWINVDRGELYIEPWTGGDKFFIDTQKEFKRRTEILPPQVETPVQAAPYEPGIDYVPILEERLIERLDANYADFKKEIMAKDKAAIFADADEIISVTQACQYFRDEHSYTADQVDYLLQFENPLMVISDRWAGTLQDISPVVRAIFDKDNQNRALQGYVLDDLVAEYIVRQTQTGENPSVLAKIRQAREAAQHAPAPRKEHPPKDQGPEL